MMKQTCFSRAGPLMFIPTVGAAILLTGCGGLEIYKDPENAPRELTTDITKAKGIPFYVKEAQCAHDTKWLYRQLAVTIADSDADTADKQTVVIPDNADALAKLRAGVFEALAKEKSLAESIAYAMSKGGDALADHSTTVATPPPPEAAIILNTWETKMVTGSLRYYVASRTPLFGTANASYKFDGDGTMTDGTSSVTDDTAKSVLATIPIADKLAVRWGITGGAAGAANRMMIAELKKKYPDLELPKFNGLPGTQDAPERSQTTPTPSLVVTLQQLQTTVSLRKVYAANSYTESPCRNANVQAPLFETAGVQVVSRGQALDDAKYKQEASSAYKIDGTITPPKAPPSSAGKGK